LPTGEARGSTNFAASEAEAGAIERAKEG
jgi:hypothetical protein